MKRLSFAALAAAALLLGPLGLRAAETAKLRHMTTVYADAQGVGLHLPEGVACDASGQFVVGDTGNDRLLRFTYSDKAVTGGSVIKIPELLAPSRVQFASKGDIYALDGRQRRIVHLGPGGEFRNVVGFDGVPPPASVLPKSFAIGPGDAIYVLDIASGRVLALDAQGKFQKALPLPEGVGFASEVAVDPVGNLLLLDSIKRRIYSATRESGAFAPVGGDLSQSLATLPSDIAAGKDGLFVAEGAGSCIVSLARDGSFLARQLTAGTEEGSLNHPAQLCVSASDDVFIADRDNSRIQVFRLIR